MAMKVGLYKTTLIAVLGAVVKQLGMGNFVSEFDANAEMTAHGKYTCLVSLKTDHNYSFVARTTINRSESDHVNSFPIESVEVVIADWNGDRASHTFNCSYTRDGFRVVNA